VTLLSAHYIQIDGHQLATYANGLEAVDGIETIPGRRIRDQAAAYIDGAYPDLTTPSFFMPKRQRLRIWVSATDANGAVTHTTGPAGHLQENLEALKRILGGQAISDHEVDWIVPTPTATRTLRNEARITLPTNSAGSSRLIRRFPITLDYPWPFFRDITAGEKTLGPFTGAQSFTPLGSAPLADATLICTAVGKIIHTQTGDEVEITSLDGATEITIIQKPPKSVTKTLGGSGDARAFYNSNRPWGLRFDAGVLANLTITGTWTIKYFEAEH